MKQEPVAYGKYIKDADMWMAVDRKVNPRLEEGFVPLYTAPKELSVEEVQEVFDNCWVDATQVSIVDFVRAILKKASEK